MKDVGDSLQNGRSAVTVPSETMRRLAALNLPGQTFREVLAIVADALDVTRKRQGCVLPESWSPGESGMAWAGELLGVLDAERELETFRDYWRAKPGREGRKLDWEATWRNWVRRVDERRAKPTNGHRNGAHQSTAAVAADLFARAVDLERRAGLRPAAAVRGGGDGGIPPWPVDDEAR